MAGLKPGAGGGSQKWAHESWISTEWAWARNVDVLAEIRGGGIKPRRSHRRACSRSSDPAPSGMRSERCWSSGERAHERHTGGAESRIGDKDIGTEAAQTDLRLQGTLKFISSCGVASGVLIVLNLTLGRPRFLSFGQSYALFAVTLVIEAAFAGRREFLLRRPALMYAAYMAFMCVFVVFVDACPVCLFFTEVGALVLRRRSMSSTTACVGVSRGLAPRALCSEWRDRR